MALDHYVSQVHLKNFYSPALNGMMHVIRKSDLRYFPARSQDVCRIKNNSSNKYLEDERAIEDFLKNVEPQYNASVAKLRDNEVDQRCIFSIAGFIGYVASCSPGAMRIGTAPLTSILEATAALLDRSGEIPKAPRELGGKSITELLHDGTIYFSVDQKYPQAIGISSILYRVSVIGNSRWEILINNHSDCPFITSDYPVAIEADVDPQIPINLIAPLAPDLAVRIIPDIRLSGVKPDLSFAKFSSAQRHLRRSEVLDINRLIVRCAEDCIFFRDDRAWVLPFVDKNRRYRIDPITVKIPHKDGYMNFSRLCVRQSDLLGSK